MNSLPKPIAITKDTVVLTRSAWDKIGRALEDANDRAAVRASKAREAEGKDDGLSAALYRRIRAGENSIRVWRHHRGLSLGELAARAIVSTSYLSAIEHDKRRGTVDALRRIADALSVDLDDLVPSNGGGG
jgi:DNA-binding Xre family transcriptional regulator